MSFSSSRRLVVAALAMGAALSPLLTQAQTGRSLQLTPQPTDNPDKVEVLEFFSYTCVHCKALDPIIESWAKNQPEDVNLVYVPLGGNSSMKPLQQFYYALEALGRKDLHSKVFSAVHDERKRLFNKDAMAEWVATQGVDRAQFESAFDSMGVNARVARADQLAQAYSVRSTPTLIVNGRYQTSPAQAGGYRESVEETDRLVQLERQRVGR